MADYSSIALERHSFAQCFSSEAWEWE